MSPFKPRSQCPGRGPRYNSCPNLVKAGTICFECQPYEKKRIRAYDEQRGNSGERGYDAQEQKVRSMKAARDPICEMCLKEGIISSLDIVHHIKPIKSHPELRLVMENLLSVCVAHHNKLHKGERWGNQ